MKKRKKIIILIISIIIAIALALAIIFAINNKNNKQVKQSDSEITYPTEEILKEVRQSMTENMSKNYNIEAIISNNEKEKITEKIEKKESDIEFTTQYRENSSLAKGKIQTIQEGQDGKQNEIVRSTYKNRTLVATQPISVEVKKVARDKIVEVGTGAYSANYVPIAGDKLKAIENDTELKKDANEQSNTIKKLAKTDTVIIKEAKNDWYNVKIDNQTGWVPKSKMEYINDSENVDGGMPVYTKEQLTQNFGISMLLNKRSGLTLEQFRQILANDPNDKQNVFKNIYQYFYYVEQQYNVNGLFVAAIAVHESGWGTSALSLRTKNLFGYGAYDRDPSAYASQFGAYESGIDLVSRVLVKYYLNPKGTLIYNGEIAQGTYFYGATVTGVNTSYASDKRWGEKVYKWMTYFYNKL